MDTVWGEKAHVTLAHSAQARRCGAWAQVRRRYARMRLEIIRIR